MKPLIKAIFSDLSIFLKRLLAYIHWNSKGVRITFGTQVSVKATIGKGCTFTGNTIITAEAFIGSYTYGHNFNIHNADIGSHCSIGPNTVIGLDAHPLDQPSTHPSFYEPIQ